MVQNTSGSGNSAFGVGSLNANTTGAHNTAIGQSALGVNTIGDFNIGIGYQALVNNTTNDNNVAIGGKDALYTNTTGGGNIAIGTSALYNSTADNNTAVGYDAGYSNTSGSNNIFIGKGSSGSSATVSNEITLGNSDNNVIRAAVTTITSLSDSRDKKNINDLSVGLNFINSLKPRVFNWDKREWYKAGVSDGSKISKEQTAGFIAQELDETQNKFNADWLKLVYKSNPNKWEATYGNLLPVLVKSIQELSAEKDKEIAELKERLKALEQIVQKLVKESK
jgi:hypothetical protein